MLLDLIFFIFIVGFAALGFVCGFFKTLISFFSWFISILLSYLLAKSIANALLTAHVAQWLVGNGSLFDKVYSIMPNGLKSISLESIRTALAQGANEEEIKALIASQTDGLMAFASRLIQNAVCKDIYLNSSISNAGQVLALELTYHIYVILIGVIFFFVLRIIIMGASLILNTKATNEGENLGRITGLALGAIRGFALACVLLMVANYLSGISTFVKEQVDSSKVSVPVTTWVSEATGKMLSGDIEDNEQYLLMINVLENREEQAVEQI